MCKCGRYIGVIVGNELTIVSDAAQGEANTMSNSKQQCPQRWCSESQHLFLGTIREICGKCGADSEEETIIC